ncbi:MAG: hypothetical protein ACP5I7_06890 [Sulfolobales archaeon]
MYIYSRDNLFIFVIFRGDSGIEYMSIIKSDDPMKALERFSRENVFREVRYVLIDENIKIDQGSLREFLERNKINLIERDKFKKLNELMSREVLDKIISFIQKQNM